MSSDHPSNTGFQPVPVAHVPTNGRKKTQETQNGVMRSRWCRWEDRNPFGWRRGSGRSRKQAGRRRQHPRRSDDSTQEPSPALYSLHFTFLAQRGTGMIRGARKSWAASEMTDAPCRARTARRAFPGSSSVPLSVLLLGNCLPCSRILGGARFPATC
jgi:hypothetical protein